MAAAKKKAPAKKKRKPNAAFMKPVQPSAMLGEVVGSKPMPRTEVTKKLWAYIKKNGLQDTKNRAQHQRRRQSEGRVRRQEDRHHVRDDQAGQQAREITFFISFRTGQERHKDALGLFSLGIANSAVSASAQHEEDSELMREAPKFVDCLGDLRGGNDLRFSG